MLGDGTFKKVLEYLHGDRKNMEEVSYENRNCSTIVPEDVAAGAGMSKRSAKRILSMLSSRDFPVLKREGYDTYHLTEIGSKCLSNMSYRNNLEKLSKMPGMKMDAETDL
jgi:predicted transcriptional regulator